MRLKQSFGCFVQICPHHLRSYDLIRRKFELWSGFFYFEKINEFTKKNQVNIEKKLFFLALYVVCKVKYGFADVQNILPKTVRTVLYHTSFRVVQYFFNMVTVERFAYHLRAANMCVFSINDVNSLLSISSWVHSICSRVGVFFFRENI